MWEERLSLSPLFLAIRVFSFCACVKIVKKTRKLPEWLCEKQETEKWHSFPLICIGSIFHNVCWVSSCFVSADAVSVPMEMEVEGASVIRELLHRLLLPEVPVGSCYPESSLLPLF